MEVLSCFDLSSNRFTHWCAVLESLARFIFCVVLSMEKDSGLIKKKLKYRLLATFSKWEVKCLSASSALLLHLRSPLIIWRLAMISSSPFYYFEPGPITSSIKVLFQDSFFEETPKNQVRGNQKTLKRSKMMSKINFRFLKLKSLFSINMNAQDVNGRTHFKVDVEIVF